MSNLSEVVHVTKQLFHPILSSKAPHQQARLSGRIVSLCRRAYAYAQVYVYAYVCAYGYYACILMPIPVHAMHVLAYAYDWRPVLMSAY